MIYPNEAARDYEFRVVVEMAKQRSPHIRRMCGGAEMALGFGSGFPIWAQIVSVYDDNDPTGRWRARLISSALGIFEDEAGELWQNDLAMRIVIPQAILESDCDAWRLDAEDFLWYIQIGGGSESLIYQRGSPLFLVGNEYDKRDNAMACEELAYLGDENIRIAVLPHSPQFGTSELYQIMNASTFGWRYDEGSGWVTPTVAVDQSFVPPDTECDCSELPGVIGTESPPTVWEVTLNGELLLDIDQIDLGLFTCYCDPENPEIGVPAIIHGYRMEEEFVNTSISARLHPADAGILRSTRMARARCSEPLIDPFYYESPYTYWGPVTSDDEVTYIAYEKDLVKLDAIKHFGFVVQAGNCPVHVPDDPPKVPPPCAPSDNTICWYEADVSHSHPKPPCDELTDSHMWRDSQGRLYTVLSGGSQIQVWRHRVNGPSDVQVVASAFGLAQGGFSPKGHHVIVYHGPDLEDAEVTRLWRIQSNSSCATGMWGEQLEIGNYTHFGFAVDPDLGIEYVIVHDTAPDPNIWKCLRKLPTETTFAERGEIAEVDVGRMAGLEVDPSSKHRLVATIKTAAAMKRFYSQDGGLTWTD